MSEARRERGSATTLAVAAMAVLLFVAVALAGLGGAVIALRSAQSAADLSALAGAETVQQGGDACGAAAVIAGRNGARLLQCSLDDEEVTVEVSVRGPRLLGKRLDVRASARAGPG